MRIHHNAQVRVATMYLMRSGRKAGTPIEITQDLRNEMLLAMEARGWSQVDLAREAGASPGMISRVLTTAKGSTFVQPICRALGIRLPGEMDPFVRQMAEDLRSLSPDKRELVTIYIRRLRDGAPVPSMDRKNVFTKSEPLGKPPRR